MSSGGAPVGLKAVRQPKAGKVKNKLPAEMQITAEQLLREAKERQLEAVPPPPRKKITDPEELADYRLRKRKEFEDNIRKNRMLITNWIKYAAWEDGEEELARARSIYERALDVSHRNITLWLKYAEMEMRRRQISHARNIWDRAISVLPRANQFWYKYTYMEEMLGNVAGARQVFERWMQWEPEEQAWFSYIKMELRYKEVLRARQIYERFVMVHPEVRNWIRYDRRGIESVVVSKRRFQYEEEVMANPANYDAWFDYLRLVEEDDDLDAIRDVYERAIANVPPSLEKRHWRRYIYLWVYYALFEELVANDAERTRQVYRACLQVIPHKTFTFAKIWLMFAEFEVRQRDLVAARRVLGNAIGRCPKDKVFHGYIELELQLREFDRCRTLYGKFLEHNPANCTTWVKFAELETLLGDVDRARAVYELAVEQPLLDMPEVLWKAYLDFEVGQEEWDNARNFYERLLDRTQHVKVWLSLAHFETTNSTADRARAVYQRAEKALRSADVDVEERVQILETWKKFEDENGNEEQQAAIKKRLPKKIKKRRAVQLEDGSQGGWEEYYDYIFPEDRDSAPNFKLLQMAHMWKKQQEGGE